jgi:chemotaxis protein MotD
MTTVSLASHSAAQPAGGAASANAFASDRSAANQRDAHDGSAFVALLGALDDAGAQTHPIGGSVSGNSATASSPPAHLGEEASPGAAAWRSVSAVHSLGSGVLVVLDKRFNSIAAQDNAPASSETPKAKIDSSADASAPTNSGWASLLMSVTGAIVAPQPHAASSTVAPAPASASLISNGGAGPRADGATNETSMPLDAALAKSTQAVALNAGAPPVDVKVVRSITYLGLDQTASKINPGRAPTSVSSRPGPTASLATGPGHGEHENLAPPPPANAKGGSYAMSSGEQSNQNMQSPGGNERASGKVTRPAGPESTSGGQAATVANSAGATSANGVPLVQIGQLADVIASAASGMDPQTGDAPSPAKAGNSVSAASMGPVKELDVQLNPASLGALSIQMRLSNGNLNITIKAENSDTLKLIGNERSSISDKLKSLNFSVETITVKALDTSASTSASGDASQSGTPGHGEARQGQSGQTADESRSNGRSFQGDSEPRKPAQPNPGGLGELGGDGNPGHRFV